MNEVPRDFAISDIQSSPVGDERSSVCQLQGTKQALATRKMRV